MKKIDRINMGKNLEKCGQRKVVGKNLEKTLQYRGRVKNEEKKLKKANVQNSQIGIPLV